MALYSEKVMDHFMNPRNVGSIENASGVGEVGNAKCGDIMKIYLQIENDIIVDCKFETFGCGSAIASSSMATEMIMGKSIHEAMELTNKAVCEALLLLLDMKGVAASSGSACTSGSLDPSHVLLAIGRIHDVAHGSLRLSICEYNTEEEIDHILTCVPKVVQQLRNMSPVWRDLQNGKREYIL